MGNLSIESQVAELCRGAETKFFMARDAQSLKVVCHALSADLKAIAGASFHTSIDRGVDALHRAALWDNPYSSYDAVRSIVFCVANDELERACAARMI